LTAASGLRRRTDIVSTGRLVAKVPPIQKRRFYLDPPERLTMRTMDIADTREKLGAHAQAGLLGDLSDGGVPGAGTRYRDL
jgi:hypothetical protein